jgi:hypothetical protein
MIRPTDPGKSRQSRQSRHPATDSTRGAWRAIDTLMRDRWTGRPAWRYGRTRAWYVPSPTGGTMTVEITLRPRWCSISIDRWRTTDRAEAVSRTWLQTHAWPLVEAALKANRTGYGVLPTGGATFASAHPIDRKDVLDLLTRWVDAELTWGLPPGVRRRQ